MSHSYHMAYVALISRYERDMRSESAASAKRQELAPSRQLISLLVSLVSLAVTSLALVSRNLVTTHREPHVSLPVHTRLVLRVGQVADGASCSRSC